MALSVRLAPGLVLANPIVAASGTFAWGTEETIDSGARARLGAIVSKGTTLRPREGNAQPRIAETPAGMLNSIGLQNVGVEAVVHDLAPVWATWRTKVIVNIAGESVAEYAAVAAALDGVPGVSGLEVNISCPNVDAGGMEFGIDPVSAARITAAVRKATRLPVIVKLSPNVTDIVPIAKAAVEVGADALTVINTLRGMAIDIRTGRPVLARVAGGLSGPAIKPVALWAVWRVTEAVKVPVIGCGGVMKAGDAVEFLMAGAQAVQVGTANLTNPDGALEVLEGLEDWARKRGLADLSTVIGCARS
jgi:dihydroorotate dehydrogenase (NAD+) catalytic subunit